MKQMNETKTYKILDITYEVVQESDIKARVAGTMDGKSAENQFGSELGRLYRNEKLSLLEVFKHMGTMQEEFHGIDEMALIERSVNSCLGSC